MNFASIKAGTLRPNANFNMGIEENSNTISLNSEGQNLRNLANNNVNIGTRFYLKRFYFSASLGYGEERQSCIMPTHVAHVGKVSVAFTRLTASAIKFLSGTTSWKYLPMEREQKT